MPRSIVNSRSWTSCSGAPAGWPIAWNSAYDGGHLLGEVADLGGSPDAGDDVLALGVDEVLAVEDALAGVRVAGERDAGAGVVAHVAVDHRHDVDGGAEVVGDLLAVAVVVGALAEPRGEDRLDGQVELLGRLGREVAAGVLADDRLELGDQRLEVVDRQVGVLRAVAVGLLGGLERLVEALGAHAEDDPPEHRDEAAVGIPAEALVAGEGDQPRQRLLVEAEVEDGVHHPRHRELGAGADRDQERVGGVTEALAGLLLDVLHGREDVLPEARRERLAGLEVVVAGLGGDGEARRRREPGVRHLGEAGALAAEEVLHGPVAFRPAVSPGVDVALGSRVGARGRNGVGHELGSPVCLAAGHVVAPRSVRLRREELYRPSAAAGRDRSARSRGPERPPALPRGRRRGATLGTAARPRGRPQAGDPIPHDPSRRGHPRHRR